MPDRLRRWPAATRVTQGRAAGRPAGRAGPSGRAGAACSRRTLDDDLDGTNTCAPGAGASGLVVVDPGPVEDGHLERLTAELGDVRLVLVTHHHFDYAEVAAELGRRKGCPVRALDPSLCVDAPLVDGE